ncbi:MBL fold metallo-hydrolase [Halanaerobium praevalens]|uniref:Beta-lactamase domain-containing protein n=1 Tax=Halanaerobium praevalens (strain ATCC 33744 / DSM 2228 / GSL) TaxID=572479 RepID=E3DLG1_HALPG|nr:MBL fold metallo-hydrolase [Halanaerobium praevalens]ADO77200.1 beta-lactamase domain-containing protein [Halanaerobium praevalens DSM 2228]
MKRYNILTLEFKIKNDIIKVHPVLIKEGKELILFDAGYPNQLNQIESELNRLEFSINDLTKVFISHHDHDHIGSLKSLKMKNPFIEVISSKIEKSFIDGSEKSLRLVQAEKYNQTLAEEEREVGESFVKYLETINTVNVDITVKENDYIASGIRVISTPGHTPGHLSLFLEEESVLLVGDALAYENNQLSIANPEFTLDIDECINSIRKIKKMEIKKLICYHGGLVESNISDSLKKLLNKDMNDIKRRH